MEEKKLLMTHRQQQQDNHSTKAATTKPIKRNRKAKAAAPPPPSFSSPSSSPSSTSCGKAAAEYGCSCCLCCVSCPLSVIWCCFKLPCKVGIKAAQSAKRQIMSGGGGGRSCWSCGRKSYPDSSAGPYYSSSFSDIDFPSP